MMWLWYAERLGSHGQVFAQLSKLKSGRVCEQIFNLKANTKLQSSLQIPIIFILIYEHTKQDFP